ERSLMGPDEVEEWDREARTRAGPMAAYAAITTLEDMTSRILRVSPAYARDLFLDCCRQLSSARAYEAMAAGEDAEKAYDQGWDEECRRQCDWIRDIFGTPFRHAAIDPGVIGWHNGTVRKMAEGIYHEAAFERLPILADALEEAGSADVAISAHCREPGQH